MVKMNDCVSGRNTYITLESGEFLRGKIKTSNKECVALDDIFVLANRAKLGTKKIPFESISAIFSVISNTDEAEEEKVQDRIDYNKTGDRTNAFVNEVGNAVSQFMVAHFNFEDEEEAGLVTNMLMSTIVNSPVVEKILEGTDTKSGS